MKDFNIAKYLKEHSLGAHGILGKYVDLHGLNEENEGNNKASKEPYEGPKDPIDGLGYKMNRDMDVSMNEDEGPMGMPGENEDNPWVHDLENGEKFGDWTCYYEYPGVIYWHHNTIPYEKLSVYATPLFDGSDGTPIQIDVNDDTVENMKLPQGTFESFGEYAQAMKPYLDAVVEKYGQGIEEEVTVSSSGVEMEELEKPEKIYADDEYGNDDRMFDLGGEQIEQGIISLLDDGFEPYEVLELCKMFIKAHADAAAQGKKF